MENAGSVTSGTGLPAKLSAAASPAILRSTEE
jgi:hypothetical protein